MLSKERGVDWKREREIERERERERWIWKDGQNYGPILPGVIIAVFLLACLESPKTTQGRNKPNFLDQPYKYRQDLNNGLLDNGQVITDKGMCNNIRLQLM